MKRYFYNEWVDAKWKEYSNDKRGAWHPMLDKKKDWHLTLSMGGAWYPTLSMGKVWHLSRSKGFTLFHSCLLFSIILQGYFSGFFQIITTTILCLACMSISEFLHAYLHLLRIIISKNL